MKSYFVIQGPFNSTLFFCSVVPVIQIIIAVNVKTVPPDTAAHLIYLTWFIVVHCQHALRNNYSYHLQFKQCKNLPISINKHPQLLIFRSVAAIYWKILWRIFFLKPDEKIADQIQVFRASFFLSSLPYVCVLAKHGTSKETEWKDSVSEYLLLPTMQMHALVGWGTLLTLHLIP